MNDKMIKEKDIIPLKISIFKMSRSEGEKK
jgi:hypothetical protein